MGATRPVRGAKAIWGLLHFGGLALAIGSAAWGLATAAHGTTAEHVLAGVWTVVGVCSFVAAHELRHRARAGGWWEAPGVVPHRVDTTWSGGRGTGGVAMPHTPMVNFAVTVVVGLAFLGEGVAACTSSTSHFGTGATVFVLALGAGLLAIAVGYRRRCIANGRWGERANPRPAVRPERRGGPRRR